MRKTVEIQVKNNEESRKKVVKFKVKSWKNEEKF